MGQHFFFDIGNGDSLAFFWFPESPEQAPGVASPARMVGQGSIATAHGSMNHIAFDVAPEKMEEYRERLQAKGVAVTEIVNHDNSPMQASATLTDDVFVRSIYFFDPDGIMLEFAALSLALRDPHRFVRSWAAMALFEIGPAAKPATTALIELLVHETENLRGRSWAASALPEIQAEP
jgi:catechol 2,3-dioxygenase-like lactoylglutathione lyase family enzyme